MSDSTATLADDGLPIENPEDDQGVGEVTSPAETTLQDHVNAVLERATVDSSGKLILADEDNALSKELVFAVNAERRVRDTQSAYTKSRQEAKKQETIANKLTEHVLNNIAPHITQEQQFELDGLKLTDPDAWRAKLGELEQAAKTSIQTKLEEVRKEGSNMSELEVRQAQLEEFVVQTGIKLSDDVIANQIPAGYTKDLEAGKITFAQFLARSGEFLTKGKVIAGASVKDPAKKPNLGRLPGGSQPSEDAQQGDSVQKYLKETY